jgi:hypothetical protein
MSWGLHWQHPYPDRTTVGPSCRLFKQGFLGAGSALARLRAWISPDALGLALYGHLAPLGPRQSRALRDILTEMCRVCACIPVLGLRPPAPVAVLCQTWSATALLRTVATWRLRQAYLV